MNNRQNGRRRGRGGQQARNGQPGGQNNGSRLDNRARGNAAQLLEKYKTLARDAQMQGDRVNTEYYLQFADHYFRVLSENRSRFEEQQQRRPRDEFRDDYEGDDQQRAYGQNDDGDGDGWDDGDTNDRVDVEPPVQQPQPQQRNFRPRRDDRPYNEAGDGQPQRRNGNNGNGNGYAPAEAAEQDVPARIAIDLPPSISGGSEAPAEAGEDAAPRRPRRPRRPRTEAAPVEA